MLKVNFMVLLVPLFFCSLIMNGQKNKKVNSQFNLEYQLKDNASLIKLNDGMVKVFQYNKKDGCLTFKDLFNQSVHNIPFKLLRNQDFNRVVYALLKSNQSNQQNELIIFVIDDFIYNDNFESLEQEYITTTNTLYAINGKGDILLTLKDISNAEVMDFREQRHLVAYTESLKKGKQTFIYTF